MSEQDFAQALELYRTNYVQYRTTGKAEYKIAYENAQRWIDLYLGQFTNQITNGRTFVNTFLQNYSTANPDLDLLQKRFAQVRQEGPRVQDEYMMIKKINDNVEQPDYSGYYVKGGVLAALIGAIVVFSVF